MVSRVSLVGRHRLSDSSLCIFVMAKSTTLCKVVVEGRPSTTPSKPCVRLSPHTDLPVECGDKRFRSETTFTSFPIHKSLTSIDRMLAQDFKSIDKMFSEMFQSTQPD